VSLIDYIIRPILLGLSPGYLVVQVVQVVQAVQVVQVVQVLLTRDVQVTSLGV
jgi:hypothetical protein